VLNNVNIAYARDTFFWFMENNMAVFGTQPAAAFSGTLKYGTYPAIVFYLR
jgi:hypothetical protein